MTKRSKLTNATYRIIVGRNMLCAFVMCRDMLGVVGSNLKMVKFEPTTPNMSQQDGQTHATCCAQQCRHMMRCHVAIVFLTGEVTGNNVTGTLNVFKKDQSL